MIKAPDLTATAQGYIPNRQAFPGAKSEKRTAFRCQVDLVPGVSLYAYFIEGQDDTLYVQPSATSQDAHWGEWHLDLVDVDPFIKVEAIGEAFTRKIRRPIRTGWNWSQSSKTEEVLDSYDVSHHRVPGMKDTHDPYQKNPQFPWLYIKVRVTHLDTGSNDIVTFRCKRPDSGKVSLKDARGLVLRIRGNFFGAVVERDFHCNSWENFRYLLACDAYDRAETPDELWAWWFGTVPTPTDPNKVPMAGVKSLWKQKAIKPNLDRLAKDEPLLYRYFLWLHHDKTLDGTSNNKLIAAFLKEHGENYTDLVKHLRESLDTAPTREIYRSKSYSLKVPHRNLCLALPGANERERKRRETKEWQFRKGAKAQAEGLGLDPTRHPKTLEAIEEGKIPISIFHEPGDKVSLVNIEFDLWERSLNQPGWAEPLYEIASSASRRGTYSKRITSYISFLFHLPRYLDRNAPRPKKVGWRCIPKYVQSQWELEMDEATEDGTTKRRSALTPVADNETGVVEVPYAAIAIQGRQTTYCYADQYIIAEAGLNDPLGNGVFVDDVVEKLNGRDDYGIMWYTLIGTSRNTGYPTFLVIFERLPRKDLDTRVHFHRVHPCRSKKGVATPTSRLIERCYRYMAGNVEASEIDAQQGDLMFIKVDKPGQAVETPIPVAAFENHSFVPLGDGVPPVNLIRSVAKAPTNRLGYVNSEKGFRVEHPEHENIEGLEAGWFEVRRCKSWEASPLAVWSLTID